MSTDIGPGDVVICVDAEGLRPGSTLHLVEGAQYVVEEVVRQGSPFYEQNTGRSGITGGDIFRLHHDRRNGYAARRFRKAGRKGMWDHLLVVEPVREPASPLWAKEPERMAKWMAYRRLHARPE